MLNTVLASFSEGVPPIPPTSFESIATATGTGSNASITFSSIPSTYKHLQVRILARNTSAAVGENLPEFDVNGDTTVAKYAYHQAYGNGATVTAGGVTGALPRYGYVVRDLTDANVMGVTILDVLDYASTTKNKTFRMLTGSDRNGAGQISLFSGLFIDTSAISSLTFYAAALAIPTTYFTSATTFALYGIKG